MTACRVVVSPFQPTLPLRGATDHLDEGGERGQFQPTLPLRGATRTSRVCSASSSFQPTLPLRGATIQVRFCVRSIPVSTHAPLAGSDAPMWLVPAFQHCFNPRSPCGERRGAVRRRCCQVRVSTHAPLAGSDKSGDRAVEEPRLFQPTLPLRGATAWFLVFPPSSGFQPTLPLRGATQAALRWLRPMSSFNPRSPCGERRNKPVLEAVNGLFQPTLPLRGATAGTSADSGGGLVSTHAPLAGSDTSWIT